MLFDDMLKERFVVIDEDGLFYTGKLNPSFSGNYGMARRYPMSAWGRSRADRAVELLQARKLKVRVAVVKPDGSVTE